MLLKHLAFCLLFNVSFKFYGITSGEILTAATGQKLLENVIRLTDSLLEVTPYINLTLSEILPNCVQMLCKFVCFHGNSSEIEQDILRTSMKNKYICSTIEELRLYNYKFAHNKISHGFLGSYTDKVDVIYLASSLITDIDAGAFAYGKFQEIYFENLQLKELRRDFFAGITQDFKKLSVIQKSRPVQTAHPDFLDYVKYQIKYLTLQTGLQSVHNLLAADDLLNNLVYMDFSHNDLGKSLKQTTFSSLTRIKYLDLSYSNLEYIPADVFATFITSLEYLDLSYNKLKTIKRNIFGWREIPHNLRIAAKGNQWSCSCALQHEMKKIFVYYRRSLYCVEPEYYSGWSVFDDKICSENSSGSTEAIVQVNETTTEYVKALSTTTNDDNVYHKSTAAAVSTTPNTNDSNSSFTKPNEYLMNLICLADRNDINERISHIMQWPLVTFNVIPRNRSVVDVVVEASEKPYDAFGLIWFNKATTEYFKMAINYKEYGLGCHKTISSVTAVQNMASDLPYTFCLVFKQQLNVSPFNCKSIYVAANNAVEQSAWLTDDMKMAGWSLVIFAIFLFLGAGMLMIYLLLKRNPILLRGSKRVKTRQANNDGFAVLPKNKSNENVSCYGPVCECKTHRRKSIDSEASYQSYINTSNLYEVIPPLEKANSRITISIPGNTTEEGSLYHQESDSCYLTPLESLAGPTDIVQYAEVACRGQRSSAAALPRVPIEKQVFSKESKDQPKYAHTGAIYIMDSQL